MSLEKLAELAQFGYQYSYDETDKATYAKIGLVVFVAALFFVLLWLRFRPAQT